MDGKSSLFEQIYSHPTLNDVIDDLTYNQFFHLRLGVAQRLIEFDHLRKSIWLASILASSCKDIHRNKVQLFSSLLFLSNNTSPDFARAAYILFSRVGNLTGTRLLKSAEIDYSSTYFQMMDLTRYFDAALGMELQMELSENIIHDGDHIITTRYQKLLWDELEKSDNIMISAPTSSGKSFVVKKFLKRKVEELEKFNAVYIVPSRALINQVSEDLRSEVDLAKVAIRTVFVREEDDASLYNIFILTPERCLRLLKSRWEKEFTLDFIFIDEIQNVEDVQGRGALFEYVFKELAVLFSKAKIIAAGPNIDASRELYESIFGMTGKALETSVSPVFQIKSTFRPLADGHLQIAISSAADKYQTVKLKTEIDFFAQFKNVGDGLREFIPFCAKNGEQNIIYCPKGNLATLWAVRYSHNNSGRDDLSSELKELIEFVEEEIHPLYELIPCLKNKTAYHHGNLPEIVRKEIEDCFLNGSIQNLFCTTTLLQGVNLPANNLFIPLAQKRNIDLTPFDFGNLIGRAGRIKDSLYGTIYCIERNDKEWSKELYLKSAKKAVKTAGEIALQSPQSLMEEISRTVADIEPKQDRSAAIFFLHKQLNDPGELESYLQKRNMPDVDIKRMLDQLRTTTINIKIPTVLLRLNPTIDPLLQDRLYSQIQSDGVENWMIPSAAENKNFHVFIEKEKMETLPYPQLSFYLQLQSIITRLNGIFQLTGEAYWKYGISTSDKQLTRNAYRWLQNKTLQQIIKEDIAFYKDHKIEKKRIDPNNPLDVNERINQVIKTNAVVTTHILIKYFKLLNDIIEPNLTDNMKERFKFSLALPTMLELGTNEPVVIRLISRGVQRSIALKIFEIFRKVPNFEELDVLVWLAAQDFLPLKPIYNRYLRRMKLLKQLHNNNSPTT